MPKTINVYDKVTNSNVEVKLHNGDLVIVKNDYNSKVVPFLVSSYIPEDSSSPEGQKMGAYCCLVNLETGGKAFAQALERKTTYNSIAHMLSNTKCLGHCVKVKDLSIVPTNNYELNIAILE